MRLLIISDLHGSPERALFLQQKAEELKPDSIVFLGDMLYHGPRNPLPSGYAPADVVKTLANFPAPVIAVRGNCDADVDVMLLPFDLQASACLYIDGLRIIARHGHDLPSEPPFAGIPRGSVLLRGHSHIPLAQTTVGVHQWNPGSPTLPKGGFPPSYGIYEQGEFRVMGLDGNIIMRHTPVTPCNQP